MLWDQLLIEGSLVEQQRFFPGFVEIFMGKTELSYAQAGVEY